MFIKHEKEFPNLRDPDEKIYELDFLAKEEESLNALSFKTPAKRRKITEKQIAVDRPEIFSFFPDDEPFLEITAAQEETLTKFIAKKNLLAKSVEASYA